MRLGLKKKDIDDLQQKIPSKDVIAEGQRLPVYHGSIEAAENSIPWLRRRRQQRRYQS